MRPIAIPLLALILLSPATAEEPKAPAGPTDAERALVLRMVEELRDETARIRGLPWKRTVPADLLTKDQVVEAFRQELAEEYPPAKVERDTKILRRTGLLAPDESIVELTLSMLREFVGGFYDPKTERLALVTGMTGDAQRPTILHELTHALDDQHFDLDGRTRPWMEDPDRQFAEKCLQEGCAEHARHIYEARNPEVADVARNQLADPELVRRQADVFRRLPHYLILPTSLQYVFGPNFVRLAVGDDFAGGMARLMADPPTTQEQVMHPDRWLGEGRDLPRRVVWGGDLAAAAGEGWKVLHELNNGELDLALYLDFHLSGRRGRAKEDGRLDLSPRAMAAAQGWDAGRDVYLEKPGRPIVWISAMAFDSRSDAAEAAIAWLDAFRASPAGGIREGLEPTGDGVASASWTTANGRGRMLLREMEILFLDGAPAEGFDALWAAVEATRLEKDPADAY
jgi:hypothetical protein